MDPITITGPDDLYAGGADSIDWTKEPQFEFPDELAALRTLGLLGEDLRAAREQVRQVMRYMSAAIVAAHAVEEDGSPVSKQAIIGSSGLARQTVYNLLGEDS